MIETLGFYFFTICSLGMFLISVFSKNTLYSMTALAGGMIFISGFFFLLGAEFLGVVQIIVYVGAVLVLYAFSMMFFDASKPVKEQKNNKLVYTLGVASSLLAVIIVLIPISYKTPIVPQYEIVSNLSNVKTVGMILFTKYLIVFELAAVMLLVAMICGILLVHKDMDKNVSKESL
ncbi:NADH-quinone oxidoreductase subunit J [Campylobacter sputorum]|uniref:NADH-quinone oxidoreductase subunit J n=1 Tax=Campylobacter sputorum TaxID=206 RepID=UPI000B7992FD|nr:NADH-quinone oxidoreductase subunit J [Campylobacter sputorum]ASM37548.1 NADH:quinone oxidoreductase I, membrane subunit J [Campylobacter sputorum bv. faecalis CCUG 20703]